MPRETRPATVPPRDRLGRLLPAGSLPATAVYVEEDPPPFATIKPLTLAERRALGKGTIDEALESRKAEYVQYHLALLNASPKVLAKYAYGLQLQQRELERAWKYVFPAPAQRIEVSTEVRQKADAELLELCRSLGIVVTKALTGRQKAEDEEPVEAELTGALAAR